MRNEKYYKHYNLAEEEILRLSALADAGSMSDFAGNNCEAATKENSEFDAFKSELFDAELDNFRCRDNWDCSKELVQEMARVASVATEDEFAKYVYINKKLIWRLATESEEVAEMLVLGYKMGISHGSSACMNDLGALYYMGDIVEQDYKKAAEYYEMAVEAGCHQSIINLGYIQSA